MAVFKRAKVISHFGVIDLLLKLFLFLILFLETRNMLLRRQKILLIPMVATFSTTLFVIAYHGYMPKALIIRE